MVFLLFVTAALIAVSGGLKIRSTTRVGLGVSPFALLEVFLALGLAVMILPGPLSGTAVERWAVPVAIGVLVLSSIEHAFRLRAWRRARAESEGGRLATYVKYLSELPNEGGGAMPGDGAAAPDDDLDLPSDDTA
ncbi:MAG: hypothetical protein R3253_13115 [Longimicrobiales bacterium]|nr:hypothetical protein [Longimicrobiales bacterium]